MSRGFCFCVVPTLLQRTQNGGAARIGQPGGECIQEEQIPRAFSLSRGTARNDKVVRGWHIPHFCNERKMVGQPVLGSRAGSAFEKSRFLARSRFREERLGMTRWLGWHIPPFCSERKMVGQPVLGSRAGSAFKKSRFLARSRFREERLGMTRWLGLADPTLLQRTQNGGAADIGRRPAISGLLGRAWRGTGCECAYQWIARPACRPGHRRSSWGCLPPERDRSLCGRDRAGWDN